MRKLLTVPVSVPLRLARRLDDGKAGVPQFAELEDRVRDDYAIVARDRAERDAVGDIIGKYDVEIAVE